MEKREHLYTIGVMDIGTASVENSMEVPQKSKNRTTIWPSNYTPGYIFEKKKNQKPLIEKDICTPKLKAELLTISKI